MNHLINNPNIVFLILAVFIFVYILTRILDYIHNYNKQNALKAKLYDKEMESRENEKVIAGLEKKNKLIHRQLSISFKNSIKLKEFCVLLQTRLSRLKVAYSQVNHRYKVLERSYKNTLNHKRTLESELANLNARYSNRKIAIKPHKNDSEINEVA